MPIMFGMCGVLFSRFLTDPVWQMAVILLSVAGLLFAGGAILASLPNRGFERGLVVGGLLFLLLGAVVAFSGLPDALSTQAEAPDRVGELSRWIGMASLLVGLLAIFFAIGRTGEAIEEIGERFRHLADHMSEGVVLMSPDGLIVFANKRFVQMTGISEEALVGQDASNVAERFRLQPVVSHMDRHWRGVASEYQVSWTVDDDVRQFWVTGTPVYNRRGQLAGSVATFRDITDQHEMGRRLERYAQGLQQLVEDRTQKLRHSENRLRELLLHMNEGFLTVDASFKVVFANNRICTLLRVSPDQMIGHFLFDFVEAAGRGRLLDLFEGRDAFPHDRMQQELSLIQTGGALVPVVIGVAPVIDASEDDARYSLVITDVTELKQMQHQLEARAAELEATNAELKSIDRAKDGFLSNVTHELRTPLSTIRGYLEMLVSSDLGPLERPQLNAMRVMLRNAQRLSHLIDEMIEFSRMEIKGIHLARTLLSPDRLVQECVASMQPQALARELSVRVEIDEGVLPLWADRKRMLQALTILLSNAVKFSQERGTVRIRLMQRPGGSAIAVADEGIGIDPAYQKRVFDKFFQVDSSLARHYEGAGIGLSIAKSIMEAHGGSIELESELGKGSVFTLTLPNASFETAPPPDIPPQFDGLRVMLVEEDGDFRKPVAQLLRGCGCRVDEINNGYEALRMAREHPPDILLVDEVMADLSGATMIAQLQQTPAMCTAPIVLFVGEGSRTPSLQDVSHGAVEFLQKPFGAADLLVAIASACFVEHPMEAATFLTPPPSPPEPVARALVIDEDPDFLAWVETVFRLRGVPCHCAGDVRQALEMGHAFQATVILLDWDIQYPSASDGLAQLRANAATQAAVVHAMTGVPPGNRNFSGVSSILQKPFSAEQLTETALRGSRSGVRKA